ncbi:MAG: HNH endonuclease, partial [Sporichthyaceae bacterium]
ADGGETSLANTALVCDFHHDQIHHHGWQIRLGSDAHPELIPPPWLDPLQRPQRNAHWKLLHEGLHNEPDRGP